MHSTEKNKIIGIDISHHNGIIDWEKVIQDKQNIKYAIIRTNDGTFLDRTFETNIKEARKKGLIVGTYFYFRFRSNIKDVLPQVDLACNRLINATAYQGEILPGIIPLTLDVEENNKLTLSEDVKTKQLHLSLERIKERTNLTPILYTMPGYWNSNFKNTGSQFSNYFPWVAHVNPNISKPMNIIGFSDYLIWQYSHTGKVDGIKGNVDLNYYNGSINDLNFFARI